MIRQNLNVVFTTDSVRRNISQNIVFFDKINEFEQQFPDLSTNWYLSKELGDYRLRCELLSGSPENQSAFQQILADYYPMILRSEHPNKTDDEIASFLQCEIRKPVI